MQYVKNDMQLSGRKRAKLLVTSEDVENLMAYLWKHDFHDYKHERMRVQMAFALILFSATGARVGTINESTMYRDSNEALWYKV